MMRRLIVLFALLVALPTLGGCAEPPYANIDNAQLKKLMDEGVVLYDIRRPEEWRQTGVVAGSRKLTYSEAGGKPHPDFLRHFTAEVAKDQPVILICRSGSRTDRLARHLVEQHGYTQVFNVQHGINRWLGNNQPVTRN